MRKKNTSRLLSAIDKTALTLAGVRDALKADAMIYQADLKRRVAQGTGIPFKKIAHMRYQQWANLRDWWIAKQRREGKTYYLANPRSKTRRKLRAKKKSYRRRRLGRLGAFKRRPRAAQIRSVTFAYYRTSGPRSKRVSRIAKKLKLSRKRVSAIVRSIP